MLLPLRLRRVLLACFACCLLAAAAQAQPEPIKFGQIDKKDLTAAPFVGDSAAAAVVLCDYGRSFLRGKGSALEVVFERITRVKILRKAGFDQATVEIPLYHRDGSQEKVTRLRAATYNWVNSGIETTKMETDGTFLEKRSPTINVQKFTLPQVREGSVIEYAYTVTSDFLFNFQDWTFQRDVPTRWSEYRVSIPVFYKYKIIYQGNEPFFIDKPSVGNVGLSIDDKLPSGAGLAAGQTTGTLTISAPTEEHQWVLKNVPAFRPEPHMTTAWDYVARLDFELTGEQWPDSPYRDLTGTWERINARLLNDDEFGGRLGRPGFLKEQLLGMDAKYPEITARAAAVRQLVMSSVRYNGLDRIYAFDPLRKAYDAHTGTSADVNLLLIAALREAGIKASPVLLSTRDHGRISKEFPLLDRFNYVIALVPLVNGKDLLVDATEPLLPCGVLPERCLSQVGRLIPSDASSEGRWVDLSPGQRRIHYQQVTLALDDKGGFTGKVHEEHGGYTGADARSEISAQGEKQYLAKRARAHDNWTLRNVALAHADHVDKPLALDYEFTQAAPDQTPATTLYMSPLAAFGSEENPFRHESRAYAVDFGVPQEETLIATITLPAGYELAEVPKPAVVEMPNGTGRFVYNASATTPGVLQITSRLSLRNAVYPASDYANLRELYRLMREKQGQKLVLKKKV